ncbi:MULTISPECIES: NAD(P)/FAD-dependent oxidoreductase [unclassified Microbacterium]|uniref:NAD(P)/FAD-dependent oxidoreductase n=1 Tax=unclassified Microbacterium TaxID=2609290 RepID=UPI00301B5BB7
MARAIIIGAGVVGLSTAWHLQKRGHEVTVIDRTGIGAGSSWGNAGWLTPGKAIPLADPSLWSYGPRALLDPDAALHVPFRFNPRLWAFLVRFAAHGTHRAWDRAMAALTPIDRIALASFDELGDSGVEVTTKRGPFVIGFTQESHSRGFLRELAGVARHGQDVPFERLPHPRDLSPQLSEAVVVAYRLDGQRFLEPAPFVDALAEAFVAEGGTIRLGRKVRSVEGGVSPRVTFDDGETETAESIVIATGAWLPELARTVGVRVPVFPGRGYSFTVRTQQPAEHPVYFPYQRIACTPYQGRFRIAGTMEFRGADEPAHPRRIQAIVNQSRHLLTGVDLDDRRDEWVGSRPVTPDGLPVVGPTRSPGIYVAGGHGMWGLVLGPATGKLLAERIDTGETPAAMAPFDPLR